MTTVNKVNKIKNVIVNKVTKIINKSSEINVNKAPISPRFYYLICTFGSVVKNPPTTAERVSSISGLGRLEKEMTTHSSILAWKILWTEEPGGLQSMGLQKSQAWPSD